MLITDAGIIIRTPSRDVRLCGRAAAGVIVMRTNGSKVANFTVVRQEETEETDETAGDADAETAENTSENAVEASANE